MTPKKNKQSDILKGGYWKVKENGSAFKLMVNYMRSSLFLWSLIHTEYSIQPTHFLPPFKPPHSHAMV